MLSYISYIDVKFLCNWLRIYNYFSLVFIIMLSLYWELPGSLRIIFRNVSFLLLADKMSICFLLSLSYRSFDN